MLTDQELFFSSINNLNDPFDSDIRINYEDLSKAQGLELIKKSIQREQPELSHFQLVIETYKRYKTSALGNAEQLKKHYEEIIRPTLQNEIGILSFTGTKNNHLLWSHYTNNHEGFCVGFHRDKLLEFAKQVERESMENGKMDLMILGEVEYVDNYPNLDPTKLSNREYFEKPFTFKSSYWCYEEEERLIYKKEGNVAFNIDKDAFAEINLGLKMPYDHKQEILEIARNEFNNIRVYQAKKLDRSFKLAFEEVNIYA